MMSAGGGGRLVATRAGTEMLMRPFKPLCPAWLFVKAKTLAED